jgi:hypothetical protein
MQTFEKPREDRVQPLRERTEKRFLAGGCLIFEADGRYGLILSRKDVPKFASNSRTNGTADENKAVVQGTISHFGRYTVSADKSIVFHIELSTYPNFNGTEQKRSFEFGRG